MADFDDRRFEAYLRETAEQSMLSDQEETALVKQWQAGITTAHEQILRGYLSRIVQLVLRIVNLRPISLLPPLYDLIAAGNLGLLEALKTFQLDAGRPFRTHALQSIRRHIARALQVRATRTAAGLVSPFPPPHPPFLPVWDRRVSRLHLQPRANRRSSRPARSIAL